jgi:hypothetical protein
VILHDGDNNIEHTVSWDRHQPTHWTFSVSSKTNVVVAVALESNDKNQLVVPTTHFHVNNVCITLRFLVLTDLSDNQ